MKKAHTSLLVVLTVSVGFALSATRAQQPGMLEAVLFDFEDGVEGWYGNPWKGGACLFESSPDARFGTNALHGWYEGVAGDGGNIISPYLPSDASWRDHDWYFISLWLKGDGSATSVSLILQDDGPLPNTFSDGLDLDGTNWHQFILSRSAFYTSGSRGCDMSGLRRVYFGGGPPRSFLVDRISLLPFHQYACLEQIAEQGTLPFEQPVAMEYAQGEYGIVLTPKTDPGESSAQVTVSLATDEGSSDQDTFNYTFSPGSEPVIVPMSVNVTTDTSVTLEIVAQGSATHMRRYRFPAFTRAPFPGPSDPAVFPLPKQLTKNSGNMPITPATKIVSTDLQDPEILNCIDILDRALRRRYGLCLARATAPGPGTSIVLGKETTGLPEEGYYLNISTDTAQIRGADGRALSYGIYSLLQVIADSTLFASAPRARCVDIEDWPSLPTRAAMIILPNGKWGYPQNPHVQLGAFLDFLDETFIQNKLNTIVLHVRNGYSFAAAPAVASRWAWKRADLETLNDFCKRRFVDIVPMVDSMGHSNWLLIPYPEYAWHNSTDTICTCNPDTWTVMTGVFAELIDIFDPSMFHIGMDEVNWDGDPDAPPCGCDAYEKWEQLGLWVDRLHDWLEPQGIRTMMWGDKLIEGHGGGAPHLTKLAVPLIPKDVIIVNWSSGVHGSSAIFNKDYGFTDVMPGNSYGHDIFQSPYICGNVASMWLKRPWLSQTDDPGSQSYSYLGILQSAEFAWNVNRERSMWNLSTSYLASRESTALLKAAAQPALCESTALRPVDIRAATNSAISDATPGPVEIAGVSFTVLPGGACVRAASNETHTIPWQGTAAGLYFLHADELPPDGAARDAFLLRWREIETMFGMDIGRYEIVYADDTTNALPIMHSWNILPRRMENIRPHAYRVLGSFRLPDDSREEANALYAAQWENPYPFKQIKEIRLVRNDTEVAVNLFGIAARYPAAAFTTGSLTRQVASGTDDAEQNADDGSMYLDSSDLELIREDGTDSHEQVVGIRFVDLTIPPRATIRAAYVQFTTDEAYDGRVSLRIYGQAIDNASTFGSGVSNISSRVKTAACVPWLPEEWATAGDAGSAQRTRDISAVVQEIVDRPGWTSGNALALILEGYGRRTAEAYEGDSAAAAVLRVWYAMPATTPVEFTAYNDLGWFAGQRTENITIHSTAEDAPGVLAGGALVDYHTGQARNAALTVTGGSGAHSSQGADPAGGTHADTLFGGKLDGTGCTTYGAQDMTLTLSGLDPAVRYELALYCDRNNPAYVGGSARYHHGTLAGAASFANVSTPGTTILTNAAPDDTTLYNAGYNGPAGYVTRYTAIDPGPDGEVTLTVARDADESYYTYANALMVRACRTAAGKAGEWSYRKGTAEASVPTHAWRTVDYDAAAWPTGDAPFGYSNEPEEGPFGTTLDDMRYFYSSVFLRREFDVSAPGQVVEAAVAVEYDDGFILWVNGQELARVNVAGSPGEHVAYDALAESSGEPKYWHSVLSGTALPALRPGKNVLAAQVLNSGLSSSDLKFDAELSWHSAVLSAETDADRDGMPDAWETRFAATLAVLEAGLDCDGDGLTDLDEYVAGSDPTNEMDRLTLDLGSGEDGVLVSFPTVEASGTGYDGLVRRYALEQRAALGATGGWTTVSGYADVAGLGQTVSYTNPAPGSCCYRARVWLSEE